MKFKGVYGEGRLTLGPFFNSDIRKICAQRIYYDGMFPDWISDPVGYITHRVQDDGTLFFALREGKRVIGYSWLDPFILELWAPFHVCKLKSRRVRKDDFIALCRLVFKYAFEELKFVKLSAAVPDFQPGYMRIAETLGMKQEGVLRSVEAYGGRLTDTIAYGILKEEL